MIEHLTKVKNILMIPKAYLREKKHNTKVVRDIVLFLMVEFAVNQVCSRLEECWSEVSDLQTMRAVIEHIIDNDISNMEETFVYCGYIWN